MPFFGGFSCDTLDARLHWPQCVTTSILGSRSSDTPDARVVSRCQSNRRGERDLTFTTRLTSAMDSDGMQGPKTAETGALCEKCFSASLFVLVL